MAILWCGGEDIDFPAGGYVNTFTSAGYYRNAFARCGITSVGGATNQFIKSNSWGSAVTSVWLSYRAYYQGACAVNSLLGGVSISSSVSAPGIYVSCSAASTTRYAIAKWDGSSATQMAAETGNSIVTSSAPQNVTLQITSYGASGNIKLYVNGISIIDYSGDIRVTGVDNFDCVVLRPGNNPSNPSVYSEIIVADEDTRAMNLFTHYPSATGDNNTWTNTYTSIDEITLDDTDVVYSTATSQEHNSKMYGYAGGVTFDVRTVKISARATKGSNSSISTLKLGVRQGGSSSVDAGRSLSSVPWATYERFMATNPVSGTGWQTSDLLNSTPLQISLQSAT